MRCCTGGRAGPPYYGHTGDCPACKVPVTWPHRYPRGFVQTGCVVSFSAQWRRGTRPLRISVAVERQTPTSAWTADEIALRLVSRACLLLRCEPEHLKVTKPHPMDGLRIKKV